MWIGVDPGSGGLLIPAPGECVQSVVARHMRLFPGTRIMRVPGAVDALPGWHSPALAAVPTGVVPHVLFRQFDLAAVLEWFDRMPAGRSLVWLTYHHDADSGLSPRLYRDRWRRLAQAVYGHRNRARVRLVPVFSLVWARRAGNDWRHWWPEVGDYMGWNCYQEPWTNRYERPAELLRTAVKAAEQVEMPLVVPELGAIRMPSDPDGLNRAAWMRGCVEYLRTSGCRSVSWWCANGPERRGHTMHLDLAVPERRVWQELSATQ